MKSLLNLLLGFCLLGSAAFAQDSVKTKAQSPPAMPLAKPSSHAAPYFSYKSGLGFTTPDSSYSLNIRFRMQNRMVANTTSDEDWTPGTYEFRVRRCRLSFTGHVYNPKWSYYIQLSFSRGDMDWNMNDASQNNTSVNTVRDAIVYYKPNTHFQIGMGQTKLPGNRQRVISSGAQQFYDRSIVNALFTLDRDAGLFANYNFHMTKNWITIFKAALTSGEGRNATISNPGLAYTGRVEMLPMGEFKDGGDYYEGDLAREPKPKLSIGASYHLNDLAVRSQGELGRDLYQSRTFETYIADFVLKYRGFALSSEYLKRRSNDPITTNASGATRNVVVGDGINTQLSYCFKSMWEVAGRHSLVTPDQTVYTAQNQAEQYGIGVTKYLVKHKFKLQGNLFYNRERNLATHKDLNKFWTLAFQVEIGI